jgi:hypothetical protein
MYASRDPWGLGNPYWGVPETGSCEATLVRSGNAGADLQNAEGEGEDIIT